MSIVAFVYPYLYLLVITRQGKFVLTVALIAITLTPLFLFKYWNFLIASLVGLGLANITTVSMYLIIFPSPPGLSFHTFQLVSYIVDVFVGRTKPEKNPAYFFLFSSFFPQLVAGPIERSNHLMPQLSHAGLVRQENIEPSLQLFLYGLFLKVAIADTLAVYVNEIYLEPNKYGIELLVATMLFYGQIYCDFAGYTMMALGVARAMGVYLPQNFNAPILARNPADFWRRWHISLSQWFRDYVYIPLGGDRFGIYRWVLAILITFLISGLWHGANMTFFVWGGIHGIGLIISKAIGKIWPKDYENDIFAILSWLFNQAFIIITWVFFRARSIEEANIILKRIGNSLLNYDTIYISLVNFLQLHNLPIIIIPVVIIVSIYVTWVDVRYFQNPSQGPFSNRGKILSCMQQLIVVTIIGFAILNRQKSTIPFIYFQF